MRKTIFFALGALLSINAWSFDNVPASIKWADGTDNAVVTSDAADGIKENKRKVGTGLTEGSRNNFAANPGETMATFNPSAKKPGVVESAMIEYSVKMKKGVTFTLTSVEYDAIKQGTDNASYHWSYTVDGVEATPVEVLKDDLLRDNNTTGSPALHHEHQITATAGQTVSLRFYVSGFDSGKLFCLSDVQINGTINGEEEVRTFTDFKIEFRNNPYEVILPEGGVLPTGVSVEGTNYNGGQHGVQGGTITVPVDGPVRFTFGACQYSKTDIEILKNGVPFATFSNAAPCGETAGHFDQYVTWLYNVEEAATLTFQLGSQTYLPYFFAEACDFVPQVEVRYFDTDGKTLIGSEVIEGSSALVYKYSASDVTVPDGCAFRGWFDGTTPTSLKVAEGTAVNEDLSLYAVATEIEEAALGKIFNYDFRQKSFYPEDHEVLVLNGGQYNDAQHGWAFKNGESISVQVAGNALLVVGVCKYSNTGSTEVNDANSNIVGTLDVEKEVTGDGSLQTIQYEGPATTLTFNFTATNYIHGIKVYNITQLPVKNEYGYYEIAPNDGAGFILALESASAGDKIFLPNGVYDLGETVNTQISKNNISIIGQSMEGTIIKNAPDFHNEGLGKTATLFIPTSVSGTYMQDLTLQNAMDYYGALAAGLGGGRACSLQDEGKQTVLKNVRMLSYQDTYYGKTAGATHYFEDCEIHGTVDFICGGSTVYFKNNILYCEKRNANGGGSDCITANGGKDEKGDKGYVFEGCTIKSECPLVSLGRAWSDQARTYFLNTLVDYSAGEFGFSGSGIQRWSQTGINTNPTEYGEYNTHLANGTVLTPSSNVVTFNKGSEVQLETVLSAERAAELTMEYTLGAWAADAQNDAKQAVCEEKAEDFEPDAIYMAEAEGEKPILFKGNEFFDKIALYNGITYTIRKANARGGFGEPGDKPGQGVDNTSAEAQKVQKIVRDGKVVIIRDNKEYNVLGAELR